MRIFPHVRNIQHYKDLSRRERQIVDILHARGAASAHEVRMDLDDEASYSAVRSALRLLSQKGVIEYEYDGKRHVYRPAVSPAVAQRSALDHVIETFFAGSATKVLAALLSRRDIEVSEHELKELEKVVAQARRKRSKS